MAGQERHSLLQGHARFYAVVPLEKMVAAAKSLRWQAWADEHWTRAWNGWRHFENRPEMLSRPPRYRAYRADFAARYADFRFADCGWRKATLSSTASTKEADPASSKISCRRRVSGEELP